MDKITIKCFACEAEHTIPKHDAKKLDYYTCDTYECMDILFKKIATANKITDIDVFMNHRGPIKLGDNIAGHNFFRYIDKRNIEYGLYGEQIIKNGNIFYLLSRELPISKRSNKEIAKFISIFILPFLASAAKRYKIPPEIGLKAYYDEAGSKIDDQIKYIKQGHYDWLWEQELMKNGYKPLFSA